MKIGFCLAAFIVGCFVTVSFKANAPRSASASGSTIETGVESVNPASQPESPKALEMEIVTRSFGKTKNGDTVTQFICRNANGYVLEMIDYGATVTAFRAPDKNGKLENVTLSCSDMAGYEACSSYFGSTVGRYCNRIAKGKFSIDGTEYTLAANYGANHLHGGKVGFD